MVYGGETHELPPCCVYAIFPFQPLQCLDFVSWGNYCMRKRGHGEVSILVGFCQFGWYACPAENHRFSHTWSPLLPLFLFFLTHAQSPPPPPSSSWSGSCSHAESWSVHAHARGSGSFLTCRAVAVSLHARDLSGFTRVLFPHAEGLCVGFAHAGSKRNRGCRLGFSGAGAISRSGTVCKFPY